MLPYGITRLQWVNTRAYGNIIIFPTSVWEAQQFICSISIKISLFVPKGQIDNKSALVISLWPGNSNDIHLKTISQEIPPPSITKITNKKFIKTSQGPMSWWFYHSQSRQLQRCRGDPGWRAAGRGTGLAWDWRIPGLPGHPTPHLVHSACSRLTCLQKHTNSSVKNQEKYLKIQCTSYFELYVISYVYRSFIQIKLPSTKVLSYSVDFKAPWELWNPLSKAVPRKFHGFGGHSKCNRLQYWAIIFKGLRLGKLS